MMMRLTHRLHSLTPPRATVAAAVEDAANAEGIAAAVDGSVAGKVKKID